MQAFFFINGYTSNFNKDFKPFLWGSFKALLIPYLAFALLGKGLNAVLWSETALWQKTAGDGDQVWFFLEESYWFLTALFIARILYWLLRRYINNEYYVGLVALAVMLIGFVLNHIYDGVSLDPAHYNNHLHYRNALCMMIFIWMGEMLKNHKEKWRKYIAPLSIAYIVMLITTHMIGILYPPTYTHSPHIPVAASPLYLFYATIGTISVLWLGKKINANKALEYLGKGSLVVYMTHFGYLRLLTKVLPSVTAPPYGLASGLTFYIMVFILSTTLSAATIWVFNHKYLKVFIGKF